MNKNTKIAPKHEHVNSFKETILKNVANTVDDLKMVEKKDKILVTVSGGSDSISLVLLLIALKEKYKIKLGIAHLNHMLRKEESLRDQVFVETFAKKESITFHCRQIDVTAYAKKNKLSIEQAGRKLRYEYFQHLAAKHGYTKVATGHNKNDNAELVLINLLRGSGSKGLSGIPPVRDNFYIRPLIRISKKQILDFLDSKNQEFMFDSSNHDMAYLRNKIRYKLLPHLESEFNPEIIHALDRLSNILKSEENYFEIETQKAFNACLYKIEDSSVSLFKEKMFNLHHALLNRVLRKTILCVKKNLNKISLKNIDDITAFCFDASSSHGKSIDLPGQIRVYKKNDIIIVKKEKKPLREIGKKAKKQWRAAQKESRP